MFRQIVYCASALILSDPALAGTISGGGGRLKHYEENPWFLNNTETVRYCINQDQATFHLDPAVAKAQIAYALSYWQSYFRKWEQAFPGTNDKFRVATQKFVYQSQCDATTNLSFQLGTLSTAQRRTLGNPSEWAGAAVLEDYDTTNLRARGYIYFGADSGAEAMRSSNPVGDLPWQPCGGLTFQEVALHELGHVFGLQHNEKSMMLRERAPEVSVSAAYVDALRYVENSGGCPSAGAGANQHFEVRDLTADTKFVVNVPGLIRATQAELTTSDQWRHLRLDIDNKSMIELTGDYLPFGLVTVTLPPNHPDYKNGTWRGYPSIMNGSWKGTLKTSTKTYSIHAFTQSYYQLTFAVFDPDENRILEGSLYGIPKS